MATFSGRVNVIRTIPAGVATTGEGGVAALVSLDADTADISAGGNGRPGDLRLRAAGSQTTIHLDGSRAIVWLGGNGVDGDIVVFRSTADDNNDLAQASIHVDGQAGDIKLFNADVAEDFAIDEAESVEPGTVMILSDRAGGVRPCFDAYDRRAAGVVSGAAEYAAALVLDHRSGSSDLRARIAIAGKVYCKVDADLGPVAVGDLLTTSATPGHAMVASDNNRAQGAVIGKALSPLPAGRSLIPMLVSLQ
jgi:hypothetical protein